MWQEMAVDISIIIPVYNGDDTIERCLDSLVSQTFVTKRIGSLEIIIVNDGSKDQTKEVVSNYIERYKGEVLLSCISQQNQGVSAARNRGLIEAKGEFVAFFDGDDYAKEEYYEVLWNLAIKYQADISGCNYYLQYESGLLVANRAISERVYQIEKEGLKECYLQGIWESLLACNKIFRRQMLLDGNVQFVGSYGEDIFFTLRAVAKANVLVNTSRCMYYYVQRESSAIHSSRKPLEGNEFLLRQLSACKAIPEDVRPYVFGVELTAVLFDAQASRAGANWYQSFAEAIMQDQNCVPFLMQGASQKNNCENPYVVLANRGAISGKMKLVMPRICELMLKNPKLAGTIMYRLAHMKQIYNEGFENEYLEKGIQELDLTGIWGVYNKLTEKNGKKVYQDVQKIADDLTALDILSEDDLTNKGSAEPVSEDIQKDVNGKRILYLVHSFLPEKNGGTERFVLQLARNQQENGIKPMIVTFSRKPRWRFRKNYKGILYETYYYQNIPVIAIRYQQISPGYMYKRIDDHHDGMIQFASEILKRYGIQIVHCCYSQPFASWLTACRQKQIPYLITVTDYHPFCHKTTYIRDDGTICEGSKCGRNCQKNCPNALIPNMASRYQNAKTYLLGAKYITAPSYYVKGRLNQEIPDLSVSVCPHGIDKFAFKRNGLSSKESDYCQGYIFACVGTFTQLKGFEDVICAFKKVKDSKARLFVYGKGNPSYEKLLKKMAENDERIHFEGEVSQSRIPEILSHVDTVVIPSKYPESYNFVFSEALAAGSRVIASKMGALAERMMLLNEMKDAENVNESLFGYQSGDVEKLANIMNQLCGSGFYRENVKKKWDIYIADISSEGDFYRSLYSKML